MVQINPITDKSSDCVKETYNESIAKSFNEILLGLAIDIAKEPDIFELYKSLSYLARILVQELTIRNGILMNIPKTRFSLPFMILFNSKIISWVLLKSLA